MTRQSLIRAVSVIGLAAVPTAGWAGAAETNSPSSAVAEVVVTARKQSETDVKVPVALTTVTSRDLEKYSVTALADVAKMTPALQIGSTVTATGTTINLRGIGGDAVSAFIAQPVSITIDGVQLNQGNVALLGLHDLARVEVLKGPQALYYGKNSPAGIISLVSSDPTRSSEGLIRTGYEFQNRQTYGEAVISGPLSDTLGARLDVYGSEHTGWFRNRTGRVVGLVGPAKRRAPGQQELFGRLTLAYMTPSGDFDAKLKLSGTDIDRDYGWGSNFQAIACPIGKPLVAARIPGSLAECKVDRYFSLGDIDPATAATDPLYRDGVLYGRTREYLGALTMNYHVAEDLTLTSTTGYYKSKDTNSGSFGAVELTQIADVAVLRVTQFSQEVRLSSGYTGPINYIIGAYYERGFFSYLLPVSLGPLVSPTPRLLSKNQTNEVSKSVSVFGQVSYDISPQWALSVGGRYTDEQKDRSAFDFASPSTGFRNLQRPDQGATYKNFSPELTLTYAPTSDINLYATYRTGFKSGGFNVDASFDQEKVKGAEVGAKGYLISRQVKFQVATYYYKYNGLQLGDYDPNLVRTIVRNAGSAEVYGTEVAIIYSPKELPGLSLHASMSYNRADYINYVSPCYGGQTIAQGCNLRRAANGVFGGQDLAGRPLARSPKWNLISGVDYTRALGGGLRLSAAADAAYSSSFYSDVQEDPRSLQANFWKLNARLALSPDDDAWELALVGKNLTNKLTVSSSNGATFTGAGTGTAGPAVAQDLVGNIAAPRTIGIQLTLRSNILDRAR